MAFLFIEPVIIVPILLMILILFLLIVIVAIAMRIRMKRIRKMERDVKNMRKLASIISLADVKKEEIKEREKQAEEDMEKKEQVKNVKSTPKKKDGDKTIYDDRKNVSTWQAHLSKTYKDMKKKNPKAKFSDAMKAAKKTYKKAKK